MRFALKVKGIKHESQSIIIDREKCTLVDSIEDFIENMDNIIKYEGRETFAEYIGKSRIDGEPMFRIDTLQLDREDKISEILK